MKSSKPRMIVILTFFFNVEAGRQSRFYQRQLLPTQLTQFPAAPPPQARAFVTSPNGAGISGLFEFYNLQNINSVGVALTVSGLGAQMPIIEHKYHVHTHPIPPDGNCEGALGHLSPNGIPDKPDCDPRAPELCQEGDLSGKHGQLPGKENVVRRRYVDNFLRFLPEADSILGRSVVIHGLNGVRLACGNITSMLDGTADAFGQPTGLPSTVTAHYLRGNVLP